jgi:hypothetical protein
LCPCRPARPRPVTGHDHGIQSARCRSPPHVRAAARPAQARHRRGARALYAYLIPLLAAAFLLALILKEISLRTR